MATALPRENEFVEALSQLTIHASGATDAIKLVASLNEQERENFVSLADSHHVVVRALTPVHAWALSHGEQDLVKWTETILESERARISNALAHLNAVMKELEAAGCKSVVMKTLDHLPDLGNDMDLVTMAPDSAVVKVMTEKFNAHIEPRSWGDRLAHKWNFAIAGLREAIEVHVGRLGQTGEHTALARRFVNRRVSQTANGMSFYVPAPEERIFAATLQRMYRHFYFRVCDILNSAALVESGELNYTELRVAAEHAGIWPGVASYLVIVSDYMQRYRGRGLELPGEVRNAAQVGGEVLHTRARFLRVPIMPHGANLYTQQITKAAFRGDVPATFRLSLLPPLASAAAVAFRITGSDKGVW